MADAYDEHGQPLYLQDCLTVCPVAHVSEARGIAAWHCLEVENLVDTTVESMLPTPVGPVSGEVTHRVCHQRLFQDAIDRERVTLTTHAAEKAWIDGSEFPADPLATFCCLSMSLSDFLAAHGMEVKA